MCEDDEPKNSHENEEGIVIDRVDNLPLQVVSGMIQLISCYYKAYQTHESFFSLLLEHVFSLSIFFTL